MDLELKNELKRIISDIGFDFEPQIDIQKDLSKGDFSTNIAMRLGGALGSPIKAAERLKSELENSEIKSRFARIEVAPPGFINFWLSQAEIIKQIDQVIAFPKLTDKDDTETILEFGDPNPFKEPHIGHLRNLCIGESLARILESQGRNIIRANYQGDVGMHVAKAIWGIIKLGFDTLSSGSLEEKAEFLGKAYAEGAKAYDEDEKAKEEILSINKKVYEKDSDFMKVWEKGRELSLEYFETLYKALGISYDKYYFESQTAPLGKKVVEENVGEVFEKDDGAIIYRGEKLKLHTRVFVTKEGYATYEGKDLALAFLKDEDFPDAKKSIIMTANEQTEYFKVMFSALSEIDPKIAGKTVHLSYGFVNLKEGKMSSRTGNVISAFWLIEETRKKLKESFKEVSDDILDQIAVASVKWGMLQFSRESDIAFSIEDSVKIEGNSGPYMLYTYARTQSLIKKSSINIPEAKLRENLEPELLALSRLICQFETAIIKSAETFSPNILTNYLYVLAQNFNHFYEKEKVIGSDGEEQKILMINAVGLVLKKGLELLGIEAPSKI
jgi:arginyl-tRNA synthetase